MQLKTRSQTLMTGLAMFSMFFGAGNVIFPLALGHYAQDKTLFAIFGLLLTAVVMPFTGMIAMCLYEGDPKQFFARLGKAPGFLAALLIMVLLGPLGSTPRCIALSYSTLKMLFPGLSVAVFSGISCLVIFLFTFKKSRILSLVGYVLTPMLLIALGTIIVRGLIGAPVPLDTDLANSAAFWQGLKEGYNTMDLLAALFFSSVVLASLKKAVSPSENSGKQLMSIALKASLIGASLLAATYIGFSWIASSHGSELAVLGSDQLLAAITLKIMGPSAGIVVCITIALACLTTAIALCSVFADFLQKRVFNGKISYEAALIGSLILTFFVSMFEFSGISAFLGPILEVFYPALIVLTLLNIAFALKKISKENQTAKE